MDEYEARRPSVTDDATMASSHARFEVVQVIGELAVRHVIRHARLVAPRHAGARLELALGRNKCSEDKSEGGRIGRFASESGGWERSGGRNGASCMVCGSRLDVARTHRAGFHKKGDRG